MKTGTIRTLALLLGMLLLTTAASPGTAKIAPDSQQSWPAITLQLVTGGLQDPVYLTHAGDNSGRIFILEKPGRIRILKNGVLQPSPFLDITGKVQDAGEQGLLGLAFPPQYAQKGYFYVYYTDNSGNNRVARYSLGDHPDAADPDSEELILRLDHPVHDNHNGGQLAFGPDGYLYISTGDGGGGGDPFDNAQDLNTLLGKILRIDTESMNTGYQIPPGNPFAGQAERRGEIWAYGLRNPWRFSFDRQTGDLYIGDVGQGTWEEVDFQPASSPGGENYGWDRMEGFDCFQTACNPDDYTLPVFTYRTHQAGTCAVTGGYVYRGPTQTALQGIYFLGDYCSGQIWGLRQTSGGWQSQALVNTDLNISSFGEDQSGELYVVDLGGAVYRLQAQPQAAPLDHQRYLPFVHRSR